MICWEMNGGIKKSIYYCKNCRKEFDYTSIKRKKFICDSCGYHFRIPAVERISMIVDKGSFEEWEKELETENYLKDDTYDRTIRKAKEKTGLKEAIVVGKAKVLGVDIALGVCDSSFIMASMGHVVGEKVASLVEKATISKLPVFIFCCSGGARMQEGIISLMQMEKTSAALKRHSDAGLFYCSILTDPTTGGVTASFASLGDVIMAEPNATIGFAGQRVIKQTLGEELPAGFQTSEFLQEHGMIDGIVQRKRIRQMIQFLVISNKRKAGYANFTTETKREFLPFMANYIHSSFLPTKSAWEKVKDNRRSTRPAAVDYIKNIFDVFVELKGDRLYREDGSIIGGIAILDGQPVTVIADYRGKDVEELFARNFGMPMPEGYRKALRLMRQAEKFNRPIISFVNTQGAYPGVGAEERGQGWAIAQNLFELSSLRVPILVIIIGEGGSGGALATAVGDEVWMLENATYSVLSPEGYASILWKDSSRASEAAERMRMTSQDLRDLRIIDRIIPEFGGAMNKNLGEISKYMKQEIVKFLKRMDKLEINEILDNRYNRFRKF